MLRRIFLRLLGGVTSILSPLFGARQTEASVPASANAELAEAISSLPFEHFEVAGGDALSVWQRLRSERRGWPIIVGTGQDLINVAEQANIDKSQTPAAILARAAGIKYSDDFRALAEKDRQENREYMEELARRPDDQLPAFSVLTADGQMVRMSPEEIRKKLLTDAAEEPRIGDWPAQDPPEIGLSIVRDRDGRYLDRVHILLVPAADGSEAPAFLSWGGWNACPAPEYHVAALRSWNQRYGAELVGISGDIIILRVNKRPRDRDEALALAQEHYEYCDDIVSQGTETIAPLAAALMSSDWWFFWWD